MADLSQLSDDDVLKAAGIGAQSPLASMSDADILKAAGLHSSFLQNAVQPIENLPSEIGQEANNALKTITGPFPASHYGQDYMVARDLKSGIGDVLGRAGGVVQYVASPVTGAVRSLVSKPLANVGVGAGLSPTDAKTYLQDPVDIAASILTPAGAERLAAPAAQAIEKLPGVLQSIKNSAFMADTSSGAIPVPLTRTLPNIRAGFNASDVDALNAAKQTGNDTVSNAYQTAPLQSTTLTKPAETQLNNDILDQIAKIGSNGTVVGSTINATSSPKTVAAVKQIYGRIVDGFTHPITGVTTPNVPLSVSEIDGFRKLLGNTAGEDSAAASGVRSTIDNFLNNVDETHLSNGTPQAIADLNNARATAAQNFKYQDVADILVKANGDQAKIQRGLTKYLSDPANTNGLSAESIAALKEAANGTGGQKVMNLLGKLGFGTSNAVGSAATTLLSVPILGPIGAPVAAGVNTAMRYGNKLAVRGAAENALKSMTPEMRAAIAPQVAEAAPLDRAVQASPPLALPSPTMGIPGGPLVAGGGGALRSQTYGESTQAAQQAAKESELGYDPGTRGTQATNERSAGYDKLEAEFQAKKSDQMVKDWMDQQQDPASALDDVLNYMVTRSAESGQPIGPVGEAMLRARENGNLAQTLGNKPVTQMTREELQTAFEKRNKK